MDCNKKTILTPLQWKTLLLVKQNEWDEWMLAEVEKELNIMSITEEYKDKDAKMEDKQEAKSKWKTVWMNRCKEEETDNVVEVVAKCGGGRRFLLLLWDACKAMFTIKYIQ